ncbi:YgiQ family radical SAM protein [Candidatus Woesearchaeota archaeon CG10_big_fil_rev_8_21_14_0_10_34_8]|jgi:uncharacterized radical SAM protein YgiQ|nr:MAG: YgiQ family radical SAM protein [Candidatus Woesearchaeota archaeon CG10_big_fil_rev_8_21_14_0_10_34_8]
MVYDIIFITGEVFFDHPLCGIAILKRLLERKGYKVGIIETPKKEEDVKKLGKPKLFFGISSGSIDSMVRNYTPLKKLRKDDQFQDYNQTVPNRAVIVYSNWVKRFFKDSILVLGGTEATLRRFTHYDYWDNDLRRSILLDSRGNILVYGSGEKQILEIADKLKKNKELTDIPGTCIISNTLPEDFTELPSHEDILTSKKSFCDMQNNLTNNKNLAQKNNDKYIIQYKSPIYTSKDLDEYYELPFTRKIPKELIGFQFSIVTHRGCIGNCNFCTLRLTQGDRIISRSEESIIKEVKSLIKHKDFHGNIDDVGGPSANMYGMDCNLCDKDCIECKKLNRTNNRLIHLLQHLRKIKGIKKVNIRSGIRYDLASPNYLREVVEYHIFDYLRIAPEHVNKNVLKLMNKDKGNLDLFIKAFKSIDNKRQLSFYFMTAHPGSTMKEAKELADKIKTLRNAEHIQVFTPTPMSVSTCMYYTGMNPKTKKEIHIPYTYLEKKKQKRLVLNVLNNI